MIWDICSLWMYLEGTVLRLVHATNENTVMIPNKYFICVKLSKYILILILLSEN